MDIEAATDVDQVTALAVDSVSDGPASLSALQREFARQFVLTGGKARRAAILAGYSGPSAHISARRNLVNRKVVAEIERLSIVNVKAALPVAIRTLLWICMHGKDERARVQAANSLLDRGGIATKGGGLTVGVQVNVNGQQAQALISEIWDAKQRRERANVQHSITDAGQDDEAPQLLDHQPIGDGVGGDPSLGSHPGPVVNPSLPEPETADLPVPRRGYGLPSWPDEEEEEQ